MARRSRVSSFLSQWSHQQQPPSPSSPVDDPTAHQAVVPNKHDSQAELPKTFETPPPSTANLHDFSNQNSPSPNPRRRRGTSGSRSSSRPASMVQTYQPPLMEVANDTPPELQPIFTFLNSHSNKLYQEGYFLKLHDLDGRGRPSANRTWQECFAQLVGTVLSLWDAAELDGAGEDGEVTPTFINLADASIKMLETLPMNEHEGASLQNVLSVSTAANNRYLLHFNSLNALTQWTAGIRLAMYEHATLQEAYTGSLIAGKGKQLNNIRAIMERSRFKYEDWARVRFGAGTPWRRCWFVVTPPDEKEYQKMQKKTKKNLYEKAPMLNGDLKFYETNKVTKKTLPIATISNAYSAYAIYPQSKPLIDQSTLVKVEGKITIHSKKESTTEGLVFVMPETHPAVSGFEMLLRFLFPVWDTFGLYGRPNRLIADVLDQRGLMFAMPKDRRYGYLEILDVAGLIHEAGSSSWVERQWRKAMKELTSKRMLSIAEGGEDALKHRKSASRTSLPAGRSNTLRFDDAPSGRSTPQGYGSPRRAETSHGETALHHRRSASETNGIRGAYARDTPSSLSQRAPENGHQTPPPRPPPHRSELSGESLNMFDSASDKSSETPSPGRQVPPEVEAMALRSPPPGPVGAPPTFAHGSGQKPRTRPNQAPELRRGHSDLDPATLTQMAEATSAQTNPGGAVQGSSRPMDAYAPLPANGYAAPYDNGYGGNPGQRDPRQAGLGAGYQQNSHSNPRFRQGNPLATIPASPFIEQTSPILDGAYVQSQRMPPNATMVGVATSSYPDTQRPATAQSARPSNELQRNQSADRPGLDRSGSSFSMHRKPVGEPAHPEHRQQSPQRVRKDMPNPNQQWNQYSQQQQGPPAGYNGYSQQQQQQQQQQNRGLMYPGPGGPDPRGQSPYRQPGPGLALQYQLPPNPGQQGGPQQPMQGQMAMRGGPLQYAQPDPYQQPPAQRQQQPYRADHQPPQGQEWL